MASGWLAVLLTPSARANGGTVQLSNAPVGPYRVTVYTDPTPIMTGVVDVSALVERPNPTDLVEDAGVSVLAQPTDESRPVMTFAATHEQATNKLFYAANVQLPTPGQWRFTVEVGGAAGQGDASFDAEVTQTGLLNLPLSLPLLLLLPLTIVVVWLRRTGRARVVRS